MLGCAHRGCLYSPPCPGLFAASELVLVSVLSTSLSQNSNEISLTGNIPTSFQWGRTSHSQPCIFYEMTPCFLARPTQKTLGCFWKFSQLDVCPLLIRICASQLTCVTWSKWLGVLFVSAIPSSVVEGHQRGQTGPYQWSIQLNTWRSVESNKRCLGKNIRTEKAGIYWV